MKDTVAKKKEERVRPHPFVTADDDYDERKYRELLLKGQRRCWEIQLKFSD